MGAGSRGMGAPGAPRRSTGVPIWGWVLIGLATAFAVVLVPSVGVAMIVGATSSTSAPVRLVHATTDASATPTPTRTPITTTKEVVVTEPIPFEKTTAQDASMPNGQVVVTTSGQNGTKTLTYLVTLVDGKETGRTLRSEAVTVAPVSEVTTTGTYVAPAPPPPPAPAPPAAAPAAPAAPQGSGCDPNYADGCVPIDSDVDCAGGKGNGPSYFSGVARVVGKDIYGLDGDKDGYACNG